MTWVRPQKAGIEHKRSVRIAAALVPSEKVFPRKLGTAFLQSPISRGGWNCEVGDERHNGVVFH